MAPNRKKLFGCPSCGFRVTGVEDACPRCGAKFGSEARFECPFCAETVTPTTNECPSCHIAYNDFVSKAEKSATEESIDSLLSEIIEIESKQVKKEGRRLSCPKCNWLVAGTEDKCPRCGAVFSEIIAYQCPVCASLVSADAKMCDECKAVFVEEVVEELQAEMAVPEAAGASERAAVPGAARAQSEAPAMPGTPSGPTEKPIATVEPEVRPAAAKPEARAPSEAPVASNEDKAETPAVAPAKVKKKVRRRKLKPKGQ